MTHDTAPLTLVTPFTIGSLELAGRLVKSATHETRATEDGTVTDSLIGFYEPMVRGGTPLIITGNMFVSWQAKSAYKQAGINDDAKIPGLRDWAQMVHDGGGKLFAQLNHGGRQMTKPAPGIDQAVSASTVREMAQGTKPRALRVDEMPELIESFAAAAYRAQEAGMDGVQVQSAHGYLLSQFLSPYTNRRTDEYGGSLANRMRLPLRIVRAVRERVGDDFPVIVKINGTDTIPFVGVDLDEQVTVALAMQDAGVDAVEVSRGHFSSFPSTTSGNFKGYATAQVKNGAMRDASAIRKFGTRVLAPILEPVMSYAWPASEGYNLPQARAFKDALSIPVLCVGGFKTPSVMQAALTDGHCDAISVARALIADPYLYRHFTTPDPLAPVCNFCNQCIGVAGGLQIACYEGEVSSLRNRMLRADNEQTAREQTV